MFHKNKKAQHTDDDLRKEKKKAARKKIRRVIKTFMLCACVFGLVYCIGAHRKLIRALIRGD